MKRRMNKILTMILSLLVTGSVYANFFLESYISTSKVARKTNVLIGTLPSLNIPGLSLPFSNYALSKNTVGSSTDGTNFAYHAVDGITNSGGWDSAHDSVGTSSIQWMYVDLGKIVTNITKIKLFWETAAASHFSFQYSNNATNWFTFGNVTDGSPGPWTYSVGPASGRYIRLYCTKRLNEDQPWGYHLYEMRVMAYPTVGNASSTRIAPPFTPSWKNFNYSCSIPSGCNILCSFLNNAGSSVQSNFLSSGVNSFNVLPSSTASTLTVKMKLYTSPDGYSIPSLYGYSLNWSSTQTYLSLNSFRLSGQSSRTNKDILIQDNMVSLAWTPLTNSVIGQYEIFRGTGLITEDNIVSGLGLNNTISSVTTVNKTLSSCVDSSIPIIENDYYYVISVVDTNGIGTLGNNVRALSYPLNEQAGWIWVLNPWLWREGENWDNKDTGGLDSQNNASGRVTLGASFNGWAEYQVYLETAMSSANIYVRYATKNTPKMDFYLDTVKIASNVQLINTLDWNIFTFSSASLGPISAGKHTIKIDPSIDINFDGFFLYDGIFTPVNVLANGQIVTPSPWKQRKINLTYFSVSNMTAAQKHDAQLNPMISNPNCVVLADYSVEGMQNVFFKRNIPVSFNFLATNIPAGVSPSRLAIFSWDNGRWIKQDSSLQVYQGNYIITAFVNQFATFGVFESNAFDKAKKAWWTYNPFSPNNDNIADATELQFLMTKSASVSVKIFNLKGRVIKTLMNGTQRLANQVVSARWDGTDDYNKPVESGVYIYQIESEGLDIDKKVLNGTVVVVR
jgi:hypothetical protein